MSKPKGLGMQSKATEGTGAIAIFLISGDGAPKIAGMNTDLVLATGVK